MLILLCIPSPDKQNIHPFLAGCGLVYSDQSGDFVNTYAGDYINGRRLNGNGDWFGANKNNSVLVTLN
jgi:hypothetical protein